MKPERKASPFWFLLLGGTLICGPELFKIDSTIWASYICLAISIILTKWPNLSHPIQDLAIFSTASAIILEKPPGLLLTLCGLWGITHLIQKPPTEILKIRTTPIILGIFLLWTSIVDAWHGKIPIQGEITNLQLLVTSILTLLIILPNSKGRPIVISLIICSLFLYTSPWIEGIKTWHKNQTATLSSLALCALMATQSFWTKSLAIVISALTLTNPSATGRITVIALWLWKAGSKPFERHIQKYGAKRVLELSIICGILSGAILAPTLPWAIQKIGKEITVTGRFEIWYVANHKIAESPWLGQGSDYYKREGQAIHVQLDEIGIKGAHNCWINTTLLYGIPGGILFLLLWGSAWAQANCPWSTRISLALGSGLPMLMHEFPLARGEGGELLIWLALCLSLQSEKKLSEHPKSIHNQKELKKG